MILPQMSTMMVKRQDNERGVQVDGMVWYGMVCIGMVWYGMGQLCKLHCVCHPTSSTPGVKGKIIFDLELDKTCQVSRSPALPSCHKIISFLYILQYIQYNMKGLLCWYMCLHTEISFLPCKSVFYLGKIAMLAKSLFKLRPLSVYFVNLTVKQARLFKLPNCQIGGIFILIKKIASTW